MSIPKPRENLPPNLSGNAERPAFTRRKVLQGTALAGAAIGIGSVLRYAHPRATIAPQLAALRPRIEAMRQALHRQAILAVHRGQLARAGGYIFTIDVAQLMIYFAQAGEADAYRALLDHATTNLIRNDKNDPYTAGFVAWRWKAGETPDASGTTEALRLARGLWLGAKAFNRPADAELALKLIDGYARHATTDQGIWMIRNYFGFGTRAFASNSFLVDYDPDFLQEVAEERKDAIISKLAANCYGVVKSAVAPCGLLYDMIQPEVATLYPELHLTAYSPNDVIQFTNCCTTAMGVAHGLPEIARKILAFSLNRLGDLRAYYLGRTGEPVNGKTVTVSEFSTLVRLAARMNSETSVATVAERAMHDWIWFTDHADSGQVYMTTEILLAMQAVG